MDGQNDAHRFSAQLCSDIRSDILDRSVISLSAGYDGFRKSDNIAVSEFKPFAFRSPQHAVYCNFYEIVSLADNGTANTSGDGAELFFPCFYTSFMFIFFLPVITTHYYTWMKLRSQAFFCSLCLLRHPQHVADEYPVTSSRIVDKDMSDCSDDFPVLKDRTSAHSLRYPRFFSMRSLSVTRITIFFTESGSFLLIFSIFILNFST